MKPAIVVAAYNRPETLTRLLRSIAFGNYPDNVPLVISVDFGGNRRREVLDIAEAFDWKFGEKEIVKHPTHLGLSEHVLYVGSLTKKFGSIIRLEDDYFVSPTFYDYASNALEFYEKDPRIAGISLYNLWFNGITKEPFVPYLDNGDVYFVQSPWSHGQVFLSSQWEMYTSWQQRIDPHDSTIDLLHESWAALDEEEWFLPAAEYLVKTNRFYVFPRESFCTSFGDVGTHFKKPSRYFQVPLQTRRSSLRFQNLDDSIAIYDSFQEMMPDRLTKLVRDLEGLDFELDLNGTKTRSKIHHQYVITSQPSISAIRTWGLEMYPPEANIVEGISGTNLKLCRAEDIRPGWIPGLLASFRRYEYSQARLSVSLPNHIMFWIIRQLEKITSKYRRKSSANE
jgi:hypothetical protein